MKNGLMTDKEIRVKRRLLHRLEEMDLSVKQEHLREPGGVAEYVRSLFESDVNRRGTLVMQMKGQLERGFDWLAECFGDGQEMVLFVSALTRSPMAMEYIGRHGCDAYLKYSQALLYRQREDELKKACRELME